MVLRAASKPSLRGIIKRYVQRLEALPYQHITGLESKIADLERLVLRSDMGELGRQLTLLRTELRQVSLAKARQCWQASTQKVYELVSDFSDDMMICLPGVADAQVAPSTEGARPSPPLICNLTPCLR
ncbi:hypothetical protein NDU88_002242 [Pleurodeles waltl]|uniref:Uncharacterized protein n=1 Tax=Pleurodeles waltl TaxID=8319 RepID=A0AAV7T1E3_PLEWA|nr:hypothetical protein NDU88_002242 [Pleurodeles waltl]